MKKSLKVIFIFIIAAVMVVSVFSNSYAQTSSELNIDEWIGNDSSDNESQSSQSNQGEANNQEGQSNEEQSNNQENQNNEEQSNNQAQNTDNNIPEIEEAPVENKQETPTTTTTPTTETTTTPTTEKKAEEVEEAKLPQTGEKENYLLIIAAIVFAGIAIYAYLKNKKYSI